MWLTSGLYSLFTQCWQSRMYTKSCERVNKAKTSVSRSSQHATTDLHVMPHNWIGHRINCIHSQRVIQSELLVGVREVTSSQFPSEEAKKRGGGWLPKMCAMLRSSLECEMKRGIEENRKQTGHTHRCRKWLQAEANQVKAKTPNRARRAVLHLFTLSTHSATPHSVNREKRAPEHTKFYTHLKVIIMRPQLH